MAWEGRTPFEAIIKEYGLSESEVIELMRSEMQASRFRKWRKRVLGRKTKYLHRQIEVICAYRSN